MTVICVKFDSKDRITAVGISFCHVVLGTSRRSLLITRPARVSTESTSTTFDLSEKRVVSVLVKTCYAYHQPSGYVFRRVTITVNQAGMYVNITIQYNIFDLKRHNSLQTARQRRRQANMGG